MRTNSKVAIIAMGKRKNTLFFFVFTGQPPTPSTTPGLQAAAAFGFPQAAAVGGLGIIPEHLAESIHRSLRVRDEGLDSTSSPGTPVPTPISPGSLSTSEGKILPEQIAAGIHRLKVEEGMSSGGSSGFPSTPAPTPFSHHPGGVRPEDLAAGISRSDHREVYSPKCRPIF